MGLMTEPLRNKALHKLPLGGLMEESVCPKSTTRVTEETSKHPSRPVRHDGDAHVHLGRRICTLAIGI